MSDWQESTLGQVCELYQPKTISTSELVIDGKYPVYGANGVIGKYDEFNHAEPQLLITCRGATCGTVNFSQPNSWITGNAMVVRPKDGSIELAYLGHLFRGGLDLTAVITGAAQPQITRQSLAPLKIRIPPLLEQRRIADILDRADALRAKRRAALTRLDELTQAIFIEMFGDPAANPKGFTRAMLSEVIEFTGGSQPPKTTFSFQSSPDVIRLVQIRDFKSDDNITYIPRKLARRFFEVDDVMIGRYGPPVFQIFRGLSGSYNVALIKAVPRGEALNDFIFYLLQESRLHAFVVDRSERTAGQSGVNLDLLEKYPAYLPPIALQQKFSLKIRLIERQKKAHQSSLTRMNDCFASLQDRAFRGAL